MAFTSSPDDFDHLQQLTNSQNQVGMNAPSGNANVAQSSAPWYQQNGIPAVMRGTQDVLSGALGGIANVGQGIANIPNAVSNIPHMMGYGPQINAFPSPQNQPGGYQDFTKTLGVQNPNLVDKLLSGVGQYAPFNPLSDIASAQKMVSGIPDVLSSIPGIGQYLSQNAAPVAQKLTQYLMNSPRISGALNQAVPGMAFGATQDQNNPVGGALGGAVLGVGGRMLPAAGSAALGLIRPQKYANSIMDNIVNQVKNASDMYKPITNAVGDTSIYSNGFNKNQGAYAALDDSVIKDYTPDLKTLNDNFNGNPTFNNAHQLQTDLGGAIRQIQGGVLKNTASQADINTMQNMQNARASLRTDMDRFLQTNPNDPTLADQYVNATQNYAVNAAPFLSKTLSPAIKQTIQDPYNPTYVSPQILSKALQGIKNPAPDISQQLLGLQTRMGLTNLAQRGVGGIAAAHLFPGAEETAAVLGTLVGPQIAKSIGMGIPPGMRSTGIGNATSAAYPYLQQSLMANYLTGGNQNGS